MAQFVNIRPLDPADRELVYRWRNQETQVAFSSTGRRVTRLEHIQWFDRMVKDENNECYIIEYLRGACGFLRFHKDGYCSYVSIYLVRYFGSGIGTTALWLGMRKHWMQNKGVRYIVANVISENNVSSDFFEKNLFKRKWISDGVWRYEYEIGGIEKILFRLNFPFWAYTTRRWLERWWQNAKAKIL